MRVFPIVVAVVASNAGADLIGRGRPFATAVKGNEAHRPVASINADVTPSRLHRSPARRKRLWIERLERRLHLAAGDLLASFGSGGVVNGPAGVGRAVAVDAGSGAIYVIAEQPGANGSDLSISRLLPSGLPDGTFAGDGIVQIDIGGDEFAVDAAMAPDGKLVVLAETIDAQGDLTAFLVRYLPTGQRDPAFGSNGFAYLPANFFGNALAIDGAGDSYVAGAQGIRGDSSAATARVVIDGVPDNNFGSGGISSASAVGLGEFNDIAIGAGVYVTIGGSSAIAAVQRFDAAAGTLDTRFAGNGASLISPFVNGGWGVAFQTGGAIVALGAASGVSAGGQLALARLQPGGSLDGTFGGGGFVNTGIPVELGISGRQLAIGSGDSIVVAGDPVTPGPQNGLTVNRYDANGAVDPVFGAGGSVSYSASIGAFFPRGIALAPTTDDIIIAGATSPESDGSVKIVRLAGADAPPFAAFDPATGVLDVAGSTGADNVRIDVQGVTLVAQLGPDQLFFPAGGVVAVNIATGDGPDVVTLSAAVTQQVSVDLGGGNNRFSTSGTGTVTVRGGGGRDTLVGGPGNDRLLGLGNADQIFGGGGNDTIAAGSGADFVDAGPGADSIDAGDGNDAVIAGAGNDRAFGGLGDDELSGSSGNDTLDAGGGNDRVFGGDGNDLLMGGAGSDSIDGHAGLDQLSGGDGNDLLLGDDGLAETLTGDAGIDIVRPDASDVLRSCELRYRFLPG